MPFFEAVSSYGAVHLQVILGMRQSVDPRSRNPGGMAVDGFIEIDGACATPSFTSCAFSHHVTGDEAAIGGQMIREESAQALDVIPPIAMQLASDAEPAHQLGTGCRHAGPSRVAGRLVECPGGIRNDKDFKTSSKADRAGNATQTSVTIPRSRAAFSRWP